MEMIVNLNRLVAEKNKRAWTQGHLAEVCDLSLRTIRRIEKTGVASHETIKALAAVFEVSVEELIYQNPSNVDNKNLIHTEEHEESVDDEVIAETKNGKRLFVIGTGFLLIFVLLIIINFLIGFNFNDFSRKGFGSISLFIFAYGISSITLLPGEILMCISIGFYKYNETWANNVMLITSIIYMAVNPFVGVFAFIIVNILLYRLPKT